jgi:hypothetical protein
MPGVPRDLTEHQLELKPGSKPIKKRLLHSMLDKKEAIKKEITKLLAAGFMKEIHHPEWLANPLLVQKKNLAKWRMCVDYTVLDKHCPKDPFSLPHIDQIVDMIADLALLSFLNCYSCYHQIALKEED